MRKLIDARLAAVVLLIAMGLLALFHGLVLAGTLPPDIVWGGQAVERGAGLLALETVALIVTLLFALIIAARIGFIRLPRFERIVRLGMWLVFAYLCLNVIGNLTSTATLEKMIFVPVTVILALLAFRLAIEKRAPERPDGDA